MVSTRRRQRRVATRLPAVPILMACALMLSVGVLSNFFLSKDHRRSDVPEALLAQFAQKHTGGVGVKNATPPRPQDHLQEEKFSTSSSSWSLERTVKYEQQSTPKKDPTRKIARRVFDQGLAEMANTEEEVRYITNTANLSRQYRLLIRVTGVTQMQETQKRWDILLNESTIPPFVHVQVEFIPSLVVNEMLQLPSQAADWIFVVRESTYVHLSRLIHRLFADMDPAERIHMGLLTNINNTFIPMTHAGFLLSFRALEEMWTRPCLWDTEAFHEWCACQAVEWTGLQGLHPYSVRDVMKWALDGSLFRDKSQIYDSVGGPIQGVARLFITNGQMTSDAFYQQLAVDTRKTKVPKILHQIWSGPLENMPMEVREAAEGCKQMYEEQGWEYVFWDDKRLQALPGFPQLDEMTSDMNLIRHYTDAIRLYLLHQFGGVYLDVDSLCVRPFDPLLDYMEEKQVDYLAGYESQRMRGTRQVANGIMFAAPSSPVLLATVLHLGIKLSKRRSWKDRGAWIITGPYCLTETLDQWRTWVESRHIILSSAAFIPVYRLEGKDLNPSDLFALAARHGSYTIQMFQSTQKSGPLYEVIRQNEKCKSTAVKAPNGTSQQASELMIVAHPDDEVLWGGEYLLLKKKNNESSVHVVVTSTRNKHSETRRQEFLKMQEYLGYHGEWLDGKDSADDSRTLEDHVKRRIQELVCGPIQKIITHGYEGEYGHTQHQQVHDAVVDSARSCCRLDLVHVFEPLPTAGHSFSSEKKQVAMMYNSQWRVLQRFAHWRERIVPLVDYDHARAIKSCKKEAALSKSKSARICRSSTGST